jgi:ABC-2 type transport system ATP-binding protein/lipopolysaccharide transport system ATP-binding protein
MYMDIHPRDMRNRIDEIADFTELGSYLDMPVQTYSSGMMVRLAFAISTCINPEILILDEWIAAGDAHFLAKAQRRMEEFVVGSSIVVFASHSLELVEQWCRKAIYLQGGMLRGYGPVAEMIDRYRGDLELSDEVTAAA